MFTALHGRLCSAVRLLPLLLLVAASPAAAQPTRFPTHLPTAAARASAELIEINDSGLFGTVSLTAHGDVTIVREVVVGAPGVHPTHIHGGTCDDLTPNPKRPWDTVELTPTDLMGESETVIDVALAQLLRTPHVIVIHTSPEEIGGTDACGDILPAQQETVTSELSPDGASAGHALWSIAHRGEATQTGLVL